MSAPAFAPNPADRPGVSRTSSTRSSAKTVPTVACYICGERIIADPALAERLGTCLPCAQELALDEEGRERLADAVIPSPPPRRPRTAFLVVFAIGIGCAGAAFLRPNSSFAHAAEVAVMCVVVFCAFLGAWCVVADWRRAR